MDGEQSAARPGTPMPMKRPGGPGGRVLRGPRALMTDVCVAVVDYSRRHPLRVIATFLLATMLGGLHAADRLAIDTDLGKLLSADEPWRQEEIRFDRAFPQLTELLVIVIDGQTPELADAAAAAMTKRLVARPDLFGAVRWMDGDPFFRRHGLLFLPVPELVSTVEEIIAAQPLIGSLAADPSPRGLFETLNLGLQGVARGDADLAQFLKPLAAVTAVIDAALGGGAQSLSWQSLLTGQEPRKQELRRFIRVQPVRDYHKIAAGEDAMAEVRQAVQDLRLTPDHGVRVRMTGNVAIQNEELETLENGTTLSMISSTTLVTLLLFFGLRAIRLIVPILVTLMVGLVLTTWFATVAVGSLNPISVAFAVLFMGIAVDFGIQFATRYRHERHLVDQPDLAMRRTAAGIGGSLLLAAGATGAGFLAFLPTAYIGVSQLGLIAGAGMGIAVTLNLTLLPALFTLFRPRGEPEDVGYTWAAPIDAFLERRHRPVLAAAAVCAVAGLAAIPLLRFDFNPMNLRDADTESVATALDLMADPETTPFTIDVLAPSWDAAADLAARLGRLPEVTHAVTIDSFIPDDQDEKLAILRDAAMLLGPTLSPPATRPAPSLAEVRATIGVTIARLRAVPNDPVTARLATLLERVLAGDDATLQALGTALVAGLPDRLEALRLALSAEPVTRQTLPDSLRSDWTTPDGQARIMVSPAGDAGDNVLLQKFVAAVTAVAPSATGTAVTIQESARTIINAFIQAGVTALVVITLLLFLAMGRLRDVALIMAPMVLAALATAATCVTVGPVLNFANIIALPLMLGIGVAFNIYFVVNWRAGLKNHLQSSTARAVLYSALTTLVAFGSLALADHPGTASMGMLLMASLAYTLLASLLFLPAVLAALPNRAGGGGADA